MIKRKLFTALKDHLSEKEITLIVGPRQAGKTTLMKFLQQYLDQSGKKNLWLNLDVENDLQFFVSQEKLINKIKLEIGNDRGYVFIDEIQRKENAGIFLKGLFDMDLPYKFIVSGSGSLELKENIHESLAGRKRIFEISTLTFEEFVNFKTDYKYEQKLMDFFALEQNKTEELLEEYMLFGGYPRVVLEQTLSGKKAIMNDIFKSYLEKDIFYLLGIKKTEHFTNLVKIMASQIGRLTNYSELAGTLGLSQKTVNNYLWYLEKTFILGKVTPYFTNVRKEITKSPMYYFFDLGLRNFALGLFDGFQNPIEKGFVFQNFVYLSIKEGLWEGFSKVHFWRTKSGAEVDFLIDGGGVIASGAGMGLPGPIPVEVKYQKLKKPEINRSLRAYIEQSHPKKAVVVNLSLETSVMVNDSTVYYLPFWAKKWYNVG